MKCLQCGKEFVAAVNHPNQKYCSSSCRKEFHRLLPQKRRQRRQLANELANKTREQWIHEADECNLDYGTYRALREQGKSFDELKATADARKSSIHFHGKVRLKRI